ncbi:MAG TPA: dihydroorotate dehydrogenase electron transfer subunit [Bacteroidales bacterium]|nr:dihydroorotate dehydrogenase electron transfer subunit [Bacteroidales bacterium]
MKKRIEDLIVIENRKLNEQFFVLRVSSSTTLPSILPGQFLQALVKDSPSTFLRRPLSVHDVDEATNSISILIQVAGRGTESLSRLKPGDTVNMVYPLGNSFTLPLQGEKVLLTGGGCGMAPLLYLGRKIRESGIEPVFALGFRNRERVLEHDEFKKLGTVQIATEDGSMGNRGLVTDLPVFTENKWDKVYSCGPEPMMKAIAAKCSERDILCEVSLENLMACGIGVCLCCVVQTTSGNVCSCTEGPVFNTRVLKWQS